MSELPENTVTAALTFKVPQKVGWSVQNGDQSWTGKELCGLMDCLSQCVDRPLTLSLSLIFDLAGNDGTMEWYGRSIDIPRGLRVLRKIAETT